MQTRFIENYTLIPTQTHLTLLTGSHRKTFEINEFITIGRDSACNIVIDDPTVSTRHARIEKRTSGYILKDLRSRNGTWVNNVRILEAELNHMDRITCGESQFIFTFYKNEGQNKCSLQSKNEKWAKQLEKLPSIAQTQLPVLIIGESGTGKEILANAMHDLSKRKTLPFISVNCSALTETLIESELFGHIKGSFTGAISDRKGAFEAARGGTIFLDEIGDLPLSLQPKLLRALENNEIKPVGSDRNIPIDVRVVAATDQNLQKNISEGKFRQDLYFRLHILQLNPPRLKDRMEDFDDLFHRFADPVKVRFTAQALQKIKLHSWSGNIRELKNMVSRASALFPDKAIDIADVDYLIDESPVVQTPKNPYPILGMSRGVMRNFEREVIIEKLIANAGNQRKTAVELGIPKSTLHDRIRVYGINVKELKNYNPQNENIENEEITSDK